MTHYPDFDVTELQERGGIIVGSLEEAIETAEDHLYAAVVFECAKTWEQKPVRLWLNRQWYEVREINAE